MIYRDLLSVREDNSLVINEFDRIEFLEEIDNISRDMSISFFNENNILQSLKDALDKEIVEKTAKKITDSFCKSINKVYDYFYSNTAKNMNNTKILSNKALLANWTENVPLAEEINYHDYANLELNIPPIGIIVDFLKEFEGNMIEAKKLAHSYNDDARTLIFDYLTELIEKTDSIINSEDINYINKIKQKLIEATDINISNINTQSINELMQEIYVNRDGFSVTDASVINGEMVQRSFERYSKLGNTTRTMGVTKNCIVNLKNRIVDIFKSNSPKNVIKDLSKRNESIKEDKELHLILYKFYKAKIDELKKLYSTIYWIYYTRCTLIYTSSIKDRMICLKAIEYNETRKPNLVKESAIIESFKKLEETQFYDELEYGYYTALSECKDKLLNIYIDSVITEADDNKQQSSGGGIVNKAQDIAKKAANTIEGFLAKVISFIQGVWNKFLNVTKKGKWEIIKKTYSKQLEMDITLDILEVSKTDTKPKMQEIDKFIKIPNGQVNPADLESINTENVSEDIFNELIKRYTYFGTISIKKDSARKTMEEFVNKNCFDPLKEGDQIVLNDIKEFVAFLDNYDSRINDIQNDIKDINSRVKDFEHMQTSKHNDTQRTVGNIKSDNNNQTQQNQEAYYDIYTDYILELKTQDHDNPGGTKKNMDLINTYFKVYNTVLSLKMSTMNKARIMCEKLCLEYGRKAKQSNG